VSEKETIDNVAKLNDLLGFDSARRPHVAAEPLKKALDEICAEREAEAQKKAKETLQKAIDLSRQMADIEREFKKNHQKFNKELGKLLNSLNRGSGKPVPEAEQEEVEEQDES